jgi:hypothetical protein
LAIFIVDLEIVGAIEVSVRFVEAKVTLDASCVNILSGFDVAIVTGSNSSDDISIFLVVVAEVHALRFKLILAHYHASDAHIVTAVHRYMGVVTL